MDIIVSIIILAILACAIGYIVKAKKRGVKCIGCPMSGQCGNAPKKGGHGCTCNHEDK